MSAQSNKVVPIDAAQQAIDEYLLQHENKGLLRVLTCGSVDDGKSTLLGRLLYDTKLLFDDQLAKLQGDSKRHGTQGDELDFALLVDGLAAEREQGITIDVAYRFFSTDSRKFIVADCPGHEQYTRNMATGASTADLAIVLVDARKGLLPQTRRHSWICHLFGIRHIVLAVNKMDLVAYDEARFREIEHDYAALASQLGIEQVTAIPVSALKGDNMIEASAATPWYQGASLLAHLETVETTRVKSADKFRLPVQWVCRPDLDFRGYAGEVVQGVAKPGDEVVVLPSGETSRIKRIVTATGDLAEAGAGSAVTLVLDDELDISRGDVIARASQPARLADRFAVHLLWMDNQPLVAGQSYWLQSASRTVTARVEKIDYRLDVNTQAQLPAARLELNEVAHAHLNLDQVIAFEPFEQCWQLGSFILIDRQTNATVAAGRLDSPLNEAHNVHWQHTDVDQTARALIKGQTPACLWFTGLSGAGKSTLANRLEAKLHAEGYHTYLLDGDNIRHGLNQDLGFSAEDRAENIRRVAEVAKLMVDAGLIVLVSFISPYQRDRDAARQRFAAGEFHEVYVDAPVEVCAERDVKGLYAKAKAGEIKNFTGIDAPYEAPQQPEFHLNTATGDVDEQASQLFRALTGRA